MQNKAFTLSWALLFTIFLGIDIRAEETPAYPFIGKVTDHNSDHAIRVNLRGGDSTNHKILRTIQEEQELIVVRKQGDWYEVELFPEEELPAWVHADFVNLQEDQTLVSGGDRVVLRAGATTKSTPLTYISKGQSLKLLDHVNSWYKVVAPQGTRAWVHSKYVHLVRPYENSDKGATNGVEAIEERLPQIEGKVPSDFHSDQDHIHTNDEDKEVSIDENDLSSIQTESERSSNSSLATAGEEMGLNTNTNEETKKDQDNKLTDVTRIRRQFELKLNELKTSALDELESVDQMTGLSDFTAVGRLTLTTHPAAHQLQVGDRVTFQLRPATDSNREPLVDLDLYAGQEIGVEGKISEDKNRQGQRVIQVSKIVVLNPSK